MFRGFLEEVLLPADKSLQGGHQVLADSVQRRVAYLGEQLLEVVEEQLVLVGQHRQWGIVAHGTDRLGAMQRHGHSQHPQLFDCIAEGLLLLHQSQRVYLVHLSRLG